MPFLSRQMAWLHTSLHNLVQRERDRRRFKHSPYAWLFQPYMGDELVALACHAAASDRPLVNVAAVILNQRYIQSSQAWVATIPMSAAAEGPRGRGEIRRDDGGEQDDDAIAPRSESLAALVEFVGNRPLLGWHLARSFDPLNSLLKQGLGFGLPNSRVDVAKLHQRQLRRRCLAGDVPQVLNEALQYWQLPSLSEQGSCLHSPCLRGPSLSDSCLDAYLQDACLQDGCIQGFCQYRALSEATASALLYLRLQRQAAL